MKIKITMLVFSLLLLLPLVASVQASTNTFSIEPSNEATQDIQCSVGFQSIYGNLSTMGGKINFYVTDPSGNIVANYENVSFLDFRIETPQNGTYVLHLTDRPSVNNLPLRRQLSKYLPPNNITATLFYGRNYVVVLEETIHTQFSMSNTFQQIPPPIPWQQIILIIVQQLPKATSLYRQIIPEEQPNPIIDNPIEIVPLTLLISFALVSALTNDLTHKTFKLLVNQKEFQRLGLLKETKKTAKRRIQRL